MNFPSLEILESRIAPAAIVVNTLADTIDPAGSATVSLRDAITKANSQAGADTITFKHGLAGTITLAHGEMLISDTLTIKGPGAKKITIDAGAASRIFDCNDGLTTVDHAVSIAGLGLINGKVTGNTETTGNGGAIFSYEPLRLTGDVIAGNSAVGSGFSLGGGGGGVFASVAHNGTVTGGVTIQNCILTGNTTSTGGGGGMYINAGLGVKLTGSTFIGNTAPAFVGGGAFVEDNSGGSGILASGDTFSGNSAKFAGGGLHLDNPSGVATTVSKCVFVGNSENSSDGGGLHLSGPVNVVSSCTIRNNSAGLMGGGLSVFEVQSLKITGTKITGNESGTEGGGLAIFGSDPTTANIATISGSHISGNRAGTEGGGLYAAHGLSLTLSGCTVDGNQATTNGGGISTVADSNNHLNLKITGGEVSGNSTPLASGNNGGGLSATGTGNVTISGTKFDQNSTGFVGGGLYLNVAGDIGLDGLKVTRNRATSGGGILMADSGANATFHIHGGSITNNQAIFFGGGLNLSGTAAGSISGVHVTGNVASQGGGIQNADSNATLSASSVVTGNVAGTHNDTYGF